MTENPRMRPLEPERLKALSHPLRIQILNALGAYGPATASGLAERLGESSGATSYHLRQLERHGFVEEEPGRGTGRERWWKRSPGSINFDPRAFEPDTAERAAVETVLGEWHRDRIKALGDFLRHGPERVPEEWGDASYLTSTIVPLTVEQLKELGEELDAIMIRTLDRYRGQTGDGLRRVRIDLDAFPIVDLGDAAR